MRLKNLDLIVAVLIVAANVGWVQIPNRSPVLGIIFALPLILILPGYMLAQTLFCRRPIAPESSGNLFLKPKFKLEWPINPADHVILSFGLSITINIVVGFALNFLPMGLQASSWTLSLGLITIILVLLVAFLRPQKSVQAARMPGPRIAMYKYTLFGLAICIAVAAIWLSIIRPINQPPSFTQFWMLPAKSNSCQIQLGVQSFEAAPVTYRVVMTVNGTQLSTWSSIDLVPQQEWHQSILIKPKASQATYVEAQLYRTDKPEIVYREVHMTFNNVGGNKNQKTQC